MAETKAVKKQNDKSVNEQRSRLPVETQNEGGNKKKYQSLEQAGSRDVTWRLKINHFLLRLAPFIFISFKKQKANGQVKQAASSFPTTAHLHNATEKIHSPQVSGRRTPPKKRFKRTAIAANKKKQNKFDDLNICKWGASLSPTRTSTTRHTTFSTALKRLTGPAADNRPVPRDLRTPSVGSSVDRPFQPFFPVQNPKKWNCRAFHIKVRRLVSTKVQLVAGELENFKFGAKKQNSNFGATGAWHVPRSNWVKRWPLGE